MAGDSGGSNGSGPSDVERLEVIFFKIALAEDSVDGLQSIINQFLVKILSYASPSPSEPVKAKIMEMLSHLNKRLQASQTVKLPLVELFELLEDPNSSLLLLNFAKVYVKMGFRRLDAASSTALLPRVLTSLSLSPSKDPALFLFLLLCCLKQLSDKSSLENVDLPVASSLTPAVFRTFLTILLFPFGTNASVVNNPLPCLSAAEVKAMVDSGFGFNSDELEAAKLALMNLIAVLAAKTPSCSEAFALHYVIAISDSMGRVASYADVQLRHLYNAIDWTTSQSVLEALIQLYLGSITTQRPQSGVGTTISPTSINPADLRLRLKILPVISKFSSKVTCEIRSRCVQLLFDTLFSPASNAKLKQLILTFAHTWLDAWLWEKLTPLSPLLSSAFVQVAKGTGEDSVKTLAYSAIGKLFSRFPSLIEANFDLVMSMFGIIQGNSESAVNLAEDVEGALNMLAPPICQSITRENRDKVYLEVERLCNFSLECSNPVITKKISRVALRYLRLFPVNHLPSKFLLFQLCSKADVDFRTECLKAIFEPYLPKVEQPDSLVTGVANPLKPEIIYPKFIDVLNFFSEQWHAGKMNSAYAFTYGNDVLPLSANACGLICLFLRTTLSVVEASAPPADVLVATLQFSDLQRTSPFIHRYFAANTNDVVSDIFGKYSTMLMDVLKCVSESTVMFLLVELMRTCTLREFPQQSSNAMLTVCQSFASSTSNFDTVELYAELYGVVRSSDIRNDVAFKVEQLSSALPHARQPVRLLCLSHLLSCSLRNGTVPSNLAEIKDYFTEQCLSLLTSSPGGVTIDSYDRLGTLKAVAEAACLFPLWSNENLPDRIAESWAKALSAKEGRLRPWAIQAYGRLGCCMIGNKGGASEQRRQCIDKLLAITPDEDVYMWIAQSLVDLTLGPLSTSNANSWRVDPVTFDVLADDQLLSIKMAVFFPEIDGISEIEKVGTDDFNTVVDLILNSLRSSNKFIRECSLVCLFLMIRSAFKSFPDVVRSRFENINQSMFTLLAEDNAHIQQTLCEILAFMYEAMPDNEREKQLEPLVDVLMGKRTVGLSVAASGQTEVFKEGQLGEMPEGQKLSTYKELCSLASDLNQPDLIYRFMQLANHNASWLSKSCAAAGLGSILAKTSRSDKKQGGTFENSRLAGSLLSGVGKLYRYQFDPDSNVRQTMNQLWQLVVSSTGSNVRDLVNNNREVIFADIDASLPNRLWRVRESACGALSDAVRVLIDPHDKHMLKRLPSFWNAILHLCDDIKESVRLAAAKTARSLQKITIRLAQARKSSAEAKSDEPSTNITESEASQCLGAVIEILFKTGVESKAEEVRAISLATLMLLVESAGSELLASHCCALISAFLESSSSLEPQVLSYITVRANDEAELQALESVRVRAAGLSPISVAVAQCIDIVPVEALPELFIRLADLLKPSAGLLTRSATCQAVTQLILRRLRGLKSPAFDSSSPAMTRLFTALLSSCVDRSEPIRRVAASTLAQLSCLKPDVFVKKAATKACEWYLKGSLQLEEDSDPLLAKAACSLFQSLTTQCPLDVLQSEQNQATIVPCLFFAIHEKNVSEENKRVAAPQPDTWDDIWNEVTQGTDAALRKHADAICDLLTKCGEVQRYGLRLQTAIAIETVVTRAAANLTLDQSAKLLRCLVALLLGRTWSGKEKIIEIFVTCVDKLGSSKIDDGGDLYQSITACLVREARKNQLEYSVVAFKALCSVVDVASGRSKLEVFNSFDDFIARCCTSFTSTNGIAAASNGTAETNGGGQAEEGDSVSGVLKKLGVVADFIETVNKCKSLSEHLSASSESLHEETLTHIIRLFCLVMMHVTMSNSTKQLATRLLNCLEDFIGHVFHITDDVRGVNRIGDDAVLKLALLECAKLSAKLTDARNPEVAARFLKCMRHFYRARPGLHLAPYQPSPASTPTGDEARNEEANYEEVRNQIVELCGYLRSSSSPTQLGDVDFFENRIAHSAL